MKLVIVESPAKAKTINKYLGSDYNVLASYGHIRDLPAKKGSVDPEQDFMMTWEQSPSSTKPFREIKEALKKSDELILATDPDREGEAISWHVWRMLDEQKVLKDKTVHRVVFNEITKPAILEAMSNGILIIANNIPGINSLIKKNYSGILVDKNASELYISEIKKISANKKLLYKYTSACLKIVKKFDRVEFLKKYSKLLNLIKKKSGT